MMYYEHSAYKKDGVYHPAQPFTRRCLTTAEMEVGGFAQEERNGKTIWYIANLCEKMSAKRAAAKFDTSKKVKTTLWEDQEEGEAS